MFPKLKISLDHHSSNQDILEEKHPTQLMSNSMSLQLQQLDYRTGGGGKKKKKCL